MPQMAPLLWFNLFLIFSALFIISMVKMYFFMNKNLSTGSKSFSNYVASKMNWSW